MRSAPPASLARSAIVVLSVALCWAARADDLCPSGRIVVDYDASVRPELHPLPWQISYENIDPDTDVFVDDGVLTVDATEFGAVFFGREEVVDGLAPAYRFEVRSRTVDLPDLVCFFPGTCLRLGAQGMAIAQDRVLNFEIWVGEDPDTGVLMVHGSDETFDLGPVATSDFASVHIEAIRDGPVTISYEGVVRAEFLWSELPTVADLEPNPALLPLLERVSDSTVVPVFGSVRILTQWDHVRYEICRPETENVDVQVVSVAPDDPGSVVLKGGTGQTLEGFEQLKGTVTKVTALHRPFDAASEGEIVLSDTPQDVTFLTATDDGTPRSFVAFQVPPGEVSQLRFHVDEVTLDLAGESHDVGVGSGAESGIKVIPEGGRLVIPEDETVSLAVDFDLTNSLSHNRGTGFMLDPVVVALDAPAVPPPAWPPSPVIPPWLMPPGLTFPPPTATPLHPPPLAEPTLTSVEPLTGLPGDVVLLHGTSLDFAGGTVEVRFGESEPADVLAVSATEIAVRVPADATIGSVRLSTPLGLEIDSPMPFVPLIPNLGLFPAVLLHNHPADGARTAFGITLDEVHVVADHRHLAFAIQASSHIPEGAVLRVHVDMAGHVRDAESGPKFSTVLEATRDGAGGTDRIAGGIQGEHAVVVVPFGDLPRPSRDLEGGFWYFVELVRDAETISWPDGPAADARTPESSAGVVPLYPWDQVVVGMSEEAQLETVASIVGGHVIAVIDHRELDPTLGLTVVLATDPEVPLLEHVEILQAQPDLAFASPNWVLTDGLPVGTVGCPSADVQNEWDVFGDRRQYAPALHRSASLDPDVPTAHPLNRGASIRFGNVLDREIIFVFDGGVEEHPSMRGRVLTGFDARTGGPGNTDEPDGHGTRVAGVAAAALVAGTNGMEGMLGAAPEAEIFPVRVMCSDCPSNLPQRTLATVAAALGFNLPFGGGTMTMDRLFNGVDLAARVSRMDGRRPRARIVNMSAGFAVPHALIAAAWATQPTAATMLVVLASLQLSALRVQGLIGNDLLLIQSAGNWSMGSNKLQDGLMFPGSFFTRPKRVLLVGRADWMRLWTPNSFNAAGLDLIAAGECVQTPRAGRLDYGPVDGSSFSAPLVAGAAALVRAYARTLGIEDLSPRDTHDILKQTAKPEIFSIFAEGAGVLDAYGALRALQEGAVAVADLPFTQDFGEVADLSITADGSSIIVARSRLPPRLQRYGLAAGEVAADRLWTADDVFHIVAGGAEEAVVVGSRTVEIIDTGTLGSTAVFAASPSATVRPVTDAHSGDVLVFEPPGTILRVQLGDDPVLRREPLEAPPGASDLGPILAMASDVSTPFGFLYTLHEAGFVQSWIAALGEWHLAVDEVVCDACTHLATVTQGGVVALDTWDMRLSVYDPWLAPLAQSALDRNLIEPSIASHASSGHLLLVGRLLEQSSTIFTFDGSPSESFLASLYRWDGEALHLISDDAFAGPSASLPEDIRLAGDGPVPWGVGAAPCIGAPTPQCQLVQIEVEP